MLYEGKLTTKECFDALLSMSNGKSPRNDGLSKGLYVPFWQDMGSFHVVTLNYAFEYGELSTPKRQAVITLIEEKDRDLQILFKN